MADEKNQNQSAAAAGAVPSGMTPDNVKGQRGGPQGDQISGETPKGAHNQDKENRNPSGNKADRNQSDRQEGSTF
jgi:hypothetical protein